MGVRRHEVGMSFVTNCKEHQHRRAYLVVHHKLDKVEKTPRLPTCLVVPDAIKHRLEFLPAHKPVTVLVYLPDHVLALRPLALVPEEFEVGPQLVDVDLAVRLFVEPREDPRGAGRGRFT